MSRLDPVAPAIDKTRIQPETSISSVDITKERLDAALSSIDKTKTQPEVSVSSLDKAKQQVNLEVSSKDKRKEETGPTANDRIPAILGSALNFAVQDSLKKITQKQQSTGTSTVQKEQLNLNDAPKQKNSPDQDLQKISPGQNLELIAPKKSDSSNLEAAAKQQSQIQTGSTQEDGVSRLGFVILAPKYINGTTIFTRRISLDRVVPLKKWDPEEEILTHIHIKKSGGTSLDEAIVNSTAHQCKMRCANNLGDAVKPRTYTCTGIYKALCRDHFDWNMVIEGQKAGYKMAPITIMRHPVARAVSHFFYLQTVLGREDEDHYNESVLLNYDGITEFLSDFNVMLRFRHLWFDGSVGTFRANETAHIRAVRFSQAIICTQGYF